MRDFLTFNLLVFAAVVSVIPLVGNSLAAIVANIAADVNQDCRHQFTRKDFE